MIVNDADSDELDEFAVGTYTDTQEGEDNAQDVVENEFETQEAIVYEVESPEETSRQLRNKSFINALSHLQMGGNSFVGSSSHYEECKDKVMPMDGSSYMTPRVNGAPQQLSSFRGNQSGKSTGQDRNSTVNYDLSVMSQKPLLTNEGRKMYHTNLEP